MDDFVGDLIAAVIRTRELIVDLHWGPGDAPERVVADFLPVAEEAIRAVGGRRCAQVEQGIAEVLGAKIAVLASRWRPELALARPASARREDTVFLPVAKDEVVAVVIVGARRGDTAELEQA